MGKHSASCDEPYQPRGTYTADSSPQQAPIPTETRKSRLNAARAETQPQSATPKPQTSKTTKRFRPHIKDWTLGQRILAGFLLIGFILSAISTVALWPSNTPARVDKSFQETSSLPPKTSPTEPSPSQLRQHAGRPASGGRSTTHHASPPHRRAHALARLSTSRAALTRGNARSLRRPTNRATPTSAKETRSA